MQKLYLLMHSTEVRKLELLLLLSWRWCSRKLAFSNFSLCCYKLDILLL